MESLLHLPVAIALLTLFPFPETNAQARDRFDNFRDWAIYRGDKKAIQYSELDQIHSGNVTQLEVAWEYHHGDLKGPSMYSNPIMIDGLLYFTTPTVNVVALNAATGKKEWVFETAKHRPGGKVFRGRNRGVVYWDDGNSANGRIFNFVKDRVFAIDAKTGRLIKSFGEDGSIDLRKHLPVDRKKASIEVTTPGIVYRDVLIVGSRVPEGNESTPRRHSRLRRADRRVSLDLPHHPATRRARARNLGMGTGHDLRRSQSVGRILPRRGTGLGVLRDRLCGRGFYLRRLAQRREPLRQLRPRPGCTDRQKNLALPDRASRHLGL